MKVPEGIGRSDAGDRGPRGHREGERGGAHAQGFEVHRDRTGVPGRGFDTIEPVSVGRQMEGRHPLLLGRRLRRFGEEGEVERQRRTLRNGGEADPRGAQGDRTDRHDGGGHPLLRRDAPGDRRIGPRVHRRGQAGPGRRGAREEARVLRVRVPSRLFRLQRVRVQDVRSDGQASGMRIHREGRRQSVDTDRPQGRVPEETVGSDRETRAADRVPRRLRAIMLPPIPRS